MNSRRTFLKDSATVSLGFLGLETYFTLLMESCTEPIYQHNLLIDRYGPLERDGAGMVNLPAGFRYRIIAKAGSKMDDGFYHPDKPDGMATYPGRNPNELILIRNHELMPNDQGPFGISNRLLKKIDPTKVFDLGRNGYVCQGGTTTLVIDESSQKITNSFLSLAGTIRNCAGGKTPWGTWLTCEEIVVPENDKLQKAHGFNFEVPINPEASLADPIPLKDMGIFNHEAVGIDPKTSIAYQTEDRIDGLIYRFIPNQKEKYAQGGRLEALCIIDQPGVDTRNWEGTTIQVKDSFKVRWIPLTDVLSMEDDLRIRGHAAGAARFARGEGMWFGDNELFFACTNGGAQRNGQIWKYIPSKYEGTDREKEDPGKLQLLLESDSEDLLENCDNVTVAPWGDIVVCEDNAHPRIIGITPQGKCYYIAENIGHKSEFAGVCFSPSGKTLFVNIQHAGLTLAITGPWNKKGGSDMAG